MPELLGATNPVPGYDKAVNNRSAQVPSANVQLQNVPDLTKISRADGRTEQQGSDFQGSGNIRYDSNFQKFIQQLKETPNMAETLTALFSGKEGTVVLSGMQDGIATEMAKILQMLQMDEKQLLDFLSSQLKAGTRFGGGLFALLRNAYANANSGAVQNDILQFLKAYADFSSSAHIEGNMMRNLEQMADAMPARWAEKLRQMLAQLQNEMAAGDRKATIQLLQKGVFPHMSQYVEQTHDMGLPRQLLSLLALDLARYENGAEEKVLELFHQLRGYSTLKNQLQMIDDEALLKLLENAKDYGNSAAVQFSDALASAASRALRGEGSMEVQQGFQNLVAALLLNESVYMPLNHYMLPIEWDGRLLFSEMWVDPDADNNDQAQMMDRQKGNTLRFLLKVDVQSLGLFDIVLTSKRENVDIQVACPDKVAMFASQMEEAITQILTRHELRPTRVSVRKMERPVALTDVFPKIFQGRNGVNVKV